MRLIRTVILGCFLLLPVSNIQAQETGSSASFDGREWVVGYTAGNENQRVTEFYLKSEATDNWTEMVTIEEYVALKTPVNLEEHVKTRVQAIAKFCPEVRSNIIEKSDTDIIYEFAAKDCGKDRDQYKVVRTIVTPQRMFVIRYSSDSSIRSSVRKKWVKVLKEFVLQASALSEGVDQKDPEAAK